MAAPKEKPVESKQEKNKTENEEDEWEEDEEEEEEYHKNKLWQYIFPSEVSVWLLNPNKCKESFVIIDVRDVDYKRHGLKIKNAINYPIHKFKQNISMIVKDENINKCDIIIFHCMFSQFRGPQCAQLYAKNKITQNQKVMVLEGGFDEYYRKYKYDSQKEELFDKI